MTDTNKDEQRARAAGVQLVTARSELERALAGAVRGTVRADVGDHCEDFGRVVRREPLVVVQTTDAADIAACFDTARRFGVPVTVRGAGHSVHGQSLSDGGVLVELSRTPVDDLRVDGELVELPAGARWSDIELALHRRGRQMPVVPDYLGLSVGGTVSVGGFGTQSAARGAQIDHVERVRLIAPDGSVRWCSPAIEPAVFFGALAGLGMLGVIDRVVMRTDPLQPVVDAAEYRFASLRDLVSALAPLARWRTDPPSYFRCIYDAAGGNLLIGDQRAAAAAPSAERGAAIADALGRPLARATWELHRWRDHVLVKSWVRTLAGHRRLWCDYGFDYDGFAQFIDVVSRELPEAAIPSERVTLCLGLSAPAPGVGRAVLDPRGPGAAHRFSCGIYLAVPDADEHGLQRARRFLRATLDACVILGGRPYLYGYYDLDDRDREALYGADWHGLVRLKQMLDPAGVNRSGVRAPASGSSAAR